MIQNMAGDRLWIYTAIAGSIIGLAFSTWFSSTKMALWLYARFDRVLDYLVDRWGLTWLEQPKDAWRKKSDPPQSMRSNQVSCRCSSKLARSCLLP